MQCKCSLGRGDSSLHTNFVPRLERGGGCRGNVGVAKNLDVGETYPVRCSLALPHTLYVELIQPIIVQLGESREAEYSYAYIHNCTNSQNSIYVHTVSSINI